jgi:cytochrome P450 family 6
MLSDGLSKWELFLETLRKYATVGTLIRCAKNDYQVPDSKHVIPAGTQIWIPIYALNHDEGFE